MALSPTDDLRYPSEADFAKSWRLLEAVAVATCRTCLFQLPVLFPLVSIPKLLFSRVLLLPHMATLGTKSL